MRRPASSPPTARTPQSMRHSPSEPCVTSTRSASASAISALTSGAARALTLGHAFCRAAAISSLLFNVFPPANALKSSQYSANSLLNQALRLCSCATARQHSAYRTVFVDPFRRLRSVGGPIGPRRAGRHADVGDRGINDCRSHGIIEFQTASWQPPLADRFEMQPHQGFGAAVENVERGAGTRIDLEQQRVVAIHQKVGRGEAHDREGPGDRRDG